MIEVKTLIKEKAPVIYGYFIDDRELTTAYKALCICLFDTDQISEDMVLEVLRKDTFCLNDAQVKEFCSTFIRLLNYQYRFKYKSKLTTELFIHALATVVILGFGLVTWVSLTTPSIEDNPIANLLIGSLIGYSSNIFTYYFGTTKKIDAEEKSKNQNNIQK